MTWRSAWTGYWFAPAAPTDLAVSRILLFAGIFYLLGLNDYREWATAPGQLWNPVIPFRLLHVPLLSPAVVGVLQIAWRVALVLACLGLWTRGSTIIAFLLGTYLLGLAPSFGFLRHAIPPVVLALAIMMIARCGDAWSVDALRAAVRRGRGLAPDVRPSSGEYRWPIRAVWLLLALIFFSAGVSKLYSSGLQWVFSDQLALILVHRNYDTGWRTSTTWGLTLAQYPRICQVMAIGTLVTELGYPVVLTSLVARRMFVPSMFLMLLAFRVLMGPTFFALMLLHVFWVPWETVGRWLRRRLPVRAPHALLFDGGCGLCGATVAVVRRLDLLGRVAMLDAANDWPAIQGKFPIVDQAACLADMHVIAPGGRLFVGFYAYRALAWLLPLAWPALPLLYCPGVPAVGERVYRLVASRRQRAGCPIPAR